MSNTKVFFISILAFVAIHSILAQNESENDQIISVLNNYIEGTSYSFPEKVKAAFMPEAKMFLDKTGEPLFVRTIEQYAKGVAKGERGKFNGRTTNILSIDRFEGIAMAKLEVIIPKFGRRFIDMLLLKKLNNEWKIISKTAGSEVSDRKGNKALIVTSNVSNKKTIDKALGNSFSEVAIAYLEYQKAGYHVDFISPQGGKLPLAYIDAYDKFQLEALYNPNFMYAVSHTKKPSEINPSEYDIILYTGGSAPIFDIPSNKKIQDIARYIYEENKGVVAAVCHGTGGIANIKLSNGKYLVDGKKVNGYPKALEKQTSSLFKSYPFIIEELVENHGGKFEYEKERAKAYHVVDGRLVTGQNYQSSKIVAQKSIEVSKAGKK